MSDLVVLPPGWDFTPPYQITLDDLKMFADAVCELDTLNSFAAEVCNAPVEEVQRVTYLVERMHEVIERIAGPQAGEIYAPEDDPEPEPL